MSAIPCIIPAVVSAHFECLAANASARVMARTSPGAHLEEKATDSAAAAHLDGLQISGAPGRAHILSELSAPDAGEIFALGAWALLDRNEAWWQETLDLAAADPRTLPGLVEALDWLDLPLTQDAADRLLAAEDPQLRALGLQARSRQRRPPDPGPWTQALRDGDPHLRATAFRAIGIFGERRLAKAISHGAQDDDARVRYEALRAGALIGDERCARPLQVCALSDAPYAYEALDLACRITRHRPALAWLTGLSKDPSTQRLALEGAGILGDPALMPFILSAMADAALARPAAEAFVRITGLDLQDEQLEGDAPEGFESGPNDDPDDEDVATDPDEDLPWPAPEACAAWWSAHGSALRPGRRYLLGEPLDAARLHHALRVDALRYRHGHAAQRALLAPGQPLFPTLAPPHRQHMLLKAAPP